MFNFFRKMRPGNRAAAPEVETPLNRALSEGDYRAAIEILEAERGDVPNIGTLFLAVELRMVYEDFDGAEAGLKEIARIDPTLGIEEVFGAIVANARTWHDRQTRPDFDHERATLGDRPFGDDAPLYEQAMRHHARGEKEQAKRALEEAKQKTPLTSGTLFNTGGGRQSFTAIADTDDLTGPYLVCSAPGRLLDIPFAHLREIEFLPRQSFPDSMWNPARVRAWNGEEAEGRVFAYYVGTGRRESSVVRTLRMTEWDHDGGYSVGYGQRDFQCILPGNKQQMLTGINQVSRIVFKAASP